jgi:hypothetical protein
MSIKKMTWFAVMSTVLSAVSPVAASAGSDPECVFDKYAAISVAPYHLDEDFGLGTHSRLHGAQVYVAAQPGLTAEWLSLSVQRELAESAQNEQCRPSVRGVQVSVTSAGSGFWVAMSAPDERSASALLAWARSIVPAEK